MDHAPPHLFRPLTLGTLTLPNRIVVAPMCQYSATDGTAGDWHRVHLGSLALSGAGLLILEATAVSATGRITPQCLGLYSDANEAALADIVRLLRAASPIPLAVQLSHAGRKASSQAPWDGGQQIAPHAPGGWRAEAPSALPHGDSEEAPEALDADGLARVQEAFVQAARRAERIGLQGIELHAAHGYLLHQFLSPLSNRRDDAYGGSLDNRLRFPLAVFDAVKAAVQIPVWVRVSASDWVEGGWDAAQHAGLRAGTAGAGLRGPARQLGRYFTAAADPARPGLPAAAGAGAEGRAHDAGDRCRPDHRAGPGRSRHRRRRLRRRGDGTRHPVRPALALARRRRAGRPGARAAAVLALRAARREGLVHRPAFRPALNLTRRKTPAAPRA